jgi:heme/copper-type cytochrome/quinol oxidase subunit 4
MGYTAIALGILGFAVGLRFRLNVLLLLVGLLLLATLIFSISAGYSFVETAITIAAAQTILQVSYFLGLVAREVFSDHRLRSIL